MRIVALSLLLLASVAFVACSEDNDDSAAVRTYIATNFPEAPTPTAGPGGPETPPPISGEPTVQPDGLQIFLIQAGQGTTAESGMRVFVQYTGWFEDGTKFDSSLDAGPPFEVVLGRGNVIQGWDEGIPGMRVGEKRRLIIPPELAYGEEGFGAIPPNATLTFDIELVDVAPN
jgi:peptidylprolyl isomerase